MGSFYKIQISETETQNSYTNGTSEDTPLQFDLEEFIRTPDRHVPGIEVKNMDNAPFSSTVYFVLEIEDCSPYLSASDGKELEELHQSAAKQWGLYLVESLGIFDWEKNVAFIRHIHQNNICVKSSFLCLPSSSLENTLKVVVNIQIKINHTGSESRHIMIKDLPPEEQFLRANLLLDLAMLLQHGVLSFLADLPVQPSSLILNPRHVYEAMCWRSRLIFSGFESLPGISRCSVQKLQIPGAWTRGYTLSCENNHVPLLWARKSPGITSCCSVFEGVDLAANLLLCVVESNPFGRHTVYEKLENGNYFKEIATMKRQPRLKLKLQKRRTKDSMTLLLPTDPLYTPSPSSWKSSKGDYYYKSLAQKWQSGDRSELRVFRNDPPERSRLVESRKTKIQINDDSGNSVLRLVKLKAGNYILEYKKPFDALTAFSIILPTV